jgi:tetratricopeptide (TPR) repeat protein
LCLDYNWQAAKTFSQVVPAMLLVLLLIAVMLWGLLRNYLWSYPLVWFFGTLAPTSSFVPIADLAFEHRMYLPLAGFIVFFVTGGYVPASRITDRFRLGGKMFHRAAAFLVIVLLAVLGFATVRRNYDYRSAETIWRKALEVAPNNPRAYANLGSAITEQGRVDEAIGYYRKALELKPDYADAHNNLGLLLKSQGRFDEAIEHYRRALEIKPGFAEVYNNLGSIYQAQGKFDEAVEYFNRALELAPDFAEVHYNLGIIFRLQGRVDEAIEHYRRALRLKDDYYEVHYNLANALSKQGRLDEAIEHYRMALNLSPRYVEAYNNLAIALKRQERFDETVDSFKKALEIDPDYIPALNGLAQLLLTHPDPRKRDASQALTLAERAAGLTKYSDADILDTLAACYAVAGRIDLAIATAEKALALANNAGNNELADYILKRLQYYKQVKP